MRNKLSIIDYGSLKGFPKGVASEPGKGNHRVFGPRDAFMVAIILKVRAAGVSTSTAKQVAEWSTSIQTIAVNLGWDWQFAPFAGRLRSDQEWYVEIGDVRFARVVTNSCPSNPSYEATPWKDMTTGRENRTARPAVIFAAAAIPKGPYPILMMQAEQGSAKTTTVSFTPLTLSVAPFDSCPGGIHTSAVSDGAFCGMHSLQ